MWVYLVVYVPDMEFQPASMEWNFGSLFPVTQVDFSKTERVLTLIFLITGIDF